MIQPSPEKIAALDGGIVGCGTSTAVWVPYVGLAPVDKAAESARWFAASVLLVPSEDQPRRRHSIFQLPEGGEIAFWQSRTAAERRCVGTR